MNTNSPWVEKYRPQKFDDIILGKFNKKILKNILKDDSFPNLLFYGPPGTGKTTTIINLINNYQEKYKQLNKGLVIHLNASDERGIDIIRNQINKFVNSKTLFGKGLKFVILDEVDYMTKNAQQALCYLLQQHRENVRFCLICNYISKIEEALQNEFMKLRFNQLPQEHIIKFLQTIITNENIPIAKTTIQNVQSMFKSDIRSMINYIQLNQNDLISKLIADNSVWQDIIETIVKNKNLSENMKYLGVVSVKYGIEKKNIIKEVLNYIVREKPKMLTDKFLKTIEFLIHDEETQKTFYSEFFITSLQSVSLDMLM